MLHRMLSTATAVCLAAVALTAAGQALTQREADSFDKKIGALIQRGAATGAAARPLRTPLTDREVNAYFKFQGAQYLPVGVINPSLQILDNARLSAVATVDLDAVRNSKERGWTDPFTYMSGQLDIRIVGKVHAAGGKGTIEIESATLSGVPIPHILLQELVSYYSKTPENPNGFSLDQQFNLPQRIQQVDFQRGSAVIVQ